jgi:hypothetical protein
MENKPYIVYVKVNDGYITAVNSSEFLTDTTGWTEIDRGYGDKYHHAQGNYFPMPIITEGGDYRYKLVNGKPKECTVEEIKAQEEANKPAEQPSQLDRVEAQITYTAMMTDTLLEA